MVGAAAGARVAVAMGVEHQHMDESEAARLRQNTQWADRRLSPSWAVRSHVELLERGARVGHGWIATRRVKGKVVGSGGSQIEAKRSGAGGIGFGPHWSAATVVLLNGFRAVALSSHRYLPGPGAVRARARGAADADADADAPCDHHDDDDEAVGSGSGSNVRAKI